MKIEVRQPQTCSSRPASLAANSLQMRARRLKRTAGVPYVSVCTWTATARHHLPPPSSLAQTQPSLMLYRRLISFADIPRTPDVSVWERGSVGLRERDVAR